MLAINLPHAKLCARDFRESLKQQSALTKTMAKGPLRSLNRTPRAASSACDKTRTQMLITNTLVSSDAYIPLIQIRSVETHDTHTGTLLINRKVRSALRKLERRIHQVSHNALVCLAGGREEPTPLSRGGGAGPTLVTSRRFQLCRFVYQRSGFVWETFAERRVRLFSAIPSSVDPFVTTSHSHFIQLTAPSSSKTANKKLARFQLKFDRKNYEESQEV
jgi:hypothetical protein